MAVGQREIAGNSIISTRNLTEQKMRCQKRRKLYDENEGFDSRDTFRFLFLRRREVRYKRRTEYHMIEKEE